MVNFPLWLRKLVTDSVESGIEAMLALSIVNFVFPHSIADTVAILGTVAFAVAGAVVPVIRRTVPDFMTWLREQFRVPPKPLE